MDNLLQQCDLSANNLSTDSKRSWLLNNRQKLKDSNKHWNDEDRIFRQRNLLLFDKQLKLSVPNTKNCLVENALEIFDYQLANYERIALKEFQFDPFIVPGFKLTWLTDMVYEEFGLEQEDYINAPGLDGNMQFKEIAQKLAELLQDDIQTIGRLTEKKLMVNDNGQFLPGFKVLMSII